MIEVHVGSRRIALYGVLAFAVLPQVGLGQAVSPIADALRTVARSATTKLTLAAESMPPGQYAARPSPSEATFAEVVARAANVTGLYCERISGRAITVGYADEGEPKDSLTIRLHRSLASCEVALADLRDTALSDVIRMNGPKTRAAVVTELVAFWAEEQQWMTDMLRRYAIVPRLPCAGPGGEVHGGGPTCASGRNVCTAGRAGASPGMIAFLDDAPYSVRSDRLGAYRPGDRNVLSVGGDGTANMLLADLFVPAVDRRAILIDLNHPIESDGIQRGVIRAENNVNLIAQLAVGGAHALRSIREIPVGGSIPAALIAIELPLDGAVHVLQAGPQPVGHCYTDRTAVDGRGTSVGTISRPDSLTWVVELPPGSVARLFDVSQRYPAAANRGLYGVSLRLTLRSER
jgi:DinB superfamily